MARDFLVSTFRGLIPLTAHCSLLTFLVSGLDIAAPPAKDDSPELKMQDEKKKKKELIDELNRLRRRLTRLEALTNGCRRVRKRQLQAIEALQSEMTSVKVLKGLLPICAACKNIRDDKGYWNQLEVYIRDHSEAEFTHGLCPDCIRKLYPVDILKRKQQE